MAAAAAPILVPRSRLHAYLQITFCIVLFRLNPGLLPQWHHSALTILAAALALAIVSVCRVRRPRVDAVTPRWPKRATVRTTGAVGAPCSWVAGIVHRLVGGAASLTDRAWRTWSACGRAMTIWRRTAPTTGASLQALRLRLWPLVRQAPQAAWTWSTWCLRRLFSAIIYLLICTAQVNRPRRRLINVRHEMKVCVGMAAAVIRHSWRQLAWVCLCAVHFLAFTLGLTIIFPCLCAYGLVVSCIHLVLSHGSATLARGAVSYFR